MTVTLRPFFLQFLQEKLLQHLFRVSRRCCGVEGHPAERTVDGPAERLFRSDLLEGGDGNPIEDDLSLRKGNTRILAIMTAHDHGKKETEGEKGGETSAKTGRLFDDHEPPLSLMTAGSAHPFPDLHASREPLVDRTPSTRSSIATASRKARAKALNIASAIWWPFIP